MSSPAQYGLVGARSLCWYSSILPNWALSLRISLHAESSCFAVNRPDSPIMQIATDFELNPLK